MITIEREAATLAIEDLGVTLRTLLACAATGYKDNRKRKWNIVYKTVVIGSVRLKTDMVKSEGICQTSEQKPPTP